MATLPVLSCVLALSVIQFAPQDVKEPRLVETVSTGETFVLDKVLYPERPTVVVFYQETSAADRALVEQLERQAERGPVGLRLVRLKTLDAPAAQTYEIHETPTLLALDRFGNLLVRTSKVEELIPAVDRALRMARIKWVSEKDTEAPTVYRMVGGGKYPVAGIIKTMSLRPEWMEEVFELADKAHFRDGYLTRRTKEMIATYVSAINHCKF